MVSLFENYEQQYSILTADITAQVGQLTATTNKDRRQLISRIEKHVEEAQELLEQMELESREVESSRRTRCKARLDCYRAELKRLTVDYIRARSIRQGALYEDSEDLSDNHVPNDQQQRLLDNSVPIARTGNRLDREHKIVIDAQEKGSQVQNLDKQKLDNVRGGPQTSRAEFDARVKANIWKLVLTVVGISLILIVIIVSLVIWYNNRGE